MTPSHFDLNKLRSKVKVAMRKATPKDTGNLAYNALHSYVTKTGLRFTYLGSIAGYGKILNQSIMLGNKKNKHFGWHNRASANAIATVAREFNPKAKGFRIYNNRQQSYKEQVDGIIKDNPGDEALKKILKRMQAEKILQVQESWKANSAGQAYNKYNKV